MASTFYQGAAEAIAKDAAFHAEVVAALGADLDSKIMGEPLKPKPSARPCVLDYCTWVDHGYHIGQPARSTFLIVLSEAKHYSLSARWGFEVLAEALTKSAPKAGYHVVSHKIGSYGPPGEPFTVAGQVFGGNPGWRIPAFYTEKPAGGFQVVSSKGHRLIDLDANIPTDDFRLDFWPWRMATDRGGEYLAFLPEPFGITKPHDFGGDHKLAPWSWRDWWAKFDGVGQAEPTAPKPKAWRPGPRFGGLEF